MYTRITTEMRKSKSSRQAGGPSLENCKPYRNKALKAEARANAFVPNKGKYRGTHVAFVKTLFHGAPRILQDSTA